MNGAFETELLDRGPLLRLREFRTPDAPDPAHEVAQAFLDLTPTRLAMMRAAAATGDAAEVRRLAHQLHGSCGVVGAVAMETLSAQVERSTSSGGELFSRVVELEGLFARTRPLLQTLVAADNPAA
jgi:HPt (histidine-containing phosphotransfer) domain-containing protein